MFSSTSLCKSVGAWTFYLVSESPDRGRCARVESLQSAPHAERRRAGGCTTYSVLSRRVHTRTSSAHLYRHGRGFYGRRTVSCAPYALFHRAPLPRQICMAGLCACYGRACCYSSACEVPPHLKHIRYHCSPYHPRPLSHMLQHTSRSLGAINVSGGAVCAPVFERFPSVACLKSQHPRASWV
jgi:hypothetical protein